MSSCLSGGGQTYRLDLDIVKSSPSLSARSSQTSSPSSTLSESSNSPRTISIKKARTPRKRPNQTYNEAAALLSTIYPNIFSPKNLRKQRKQTKPFDSAPESTSELLPPFPVLSDAAFLIREPSPEKPAFRIEPKPARLLEKACHTSPSNELPEPGSPLPIDEDFDAESILDEEVEEGIDSIMGNLSMNTTTSNGNDEDPASCEPHIDSSLQSLMGFGLGGRFELGVGFSFARNMRRALRSRDEGDWWRTPAVPVSDIAPRFKAPTPSSPEKKKKKKKVEKKRARESLQTASTDTATAETASEGKHLKPGLGLKLNHEKVLRAWSDRGSPFSDGPESPNSTADALARLADIDLFPEGGGGGGVREASVLRYKEKRRTRLFSKKIRYQVRKVNADRRPRMKGRFVRSPSLLQQAIEEGSQ